MGRNETLSPRTRKLVVLSLKFGPLIGGNLFLILWGVTSQDTKLAIGAPVIMLSPFCLTFAYLFGLVPSAFGAVISGRLADISPNHGYRVFVSLFGGAVSTLAFPFVFIPAIAVGHGTLLAVIDMIGAGALASLVCNLITDFPSRNDDGYRVRLRRFNAAIDLHRRGRFD